MLAICLGLLLTYEVMTFFVFHFRMIQQQLVINQIQYKAEALLHILTSALHQAGLGSCGSMRVVNTFHGEAHGFSIRYMETPVATLVQWHGKEGWLKVDRGTQFKPTDAAIISDCTGEEIIHIKRVHAEKDTQVIYLSSPSNQVFYSGAEVSRLRTTYYFMGRIQRQAETHHPSYALFQKDSLSGRKELVSDIEKLDFSYLILDRGRVLEKQATEIINWQQVLGIKAEVILHIPPIRKTFFKYIVRKY